MNWLDFVLIIILIISVISGFTNGLIKTVVGFVGVIAGIYLAGKFYVGLSDYFTFVSDSIAKILAFAAILIVVILASLILAAILKRVVSILPLGWLNHLGGAVIGLLTGIITLGAILTLWLKYLGINDTIAASYLSDLLLGYFPFFLGLLPADLGSVRNFFK